MVPFIIKPCPHDGPLEQRRGAIRIRGRRTGQYTLRILGMEVARLLCKFVREADSRLKESGDRQGKRDDRPKRCEAILMVLP